MPQLLIAMDGEDEQAAERRAASMAAHIERTAELHQTGQHLLGGLLRRPGSDVIAGSLVVMNFDDRTEFDEWLASEPLMTGGVWQQTETFDIMIPPRYLAQPPSPREG